MRIVRICVTLVILLFTMTTVELSAQNLKSDPTNQTASLAPQRWQSAPAEPYTYLEPGFPVKALFGGWQQWGVCYVTVGNIDADPRLEIIASGFNDGPLYAWHHDGTDVNGWPTQLGGLPYPALGPLTTPLPGALDVFTANAKDWPKDMAAYGGDGQFLAGLWPLKSAYRIFRPPALEDVTGDGIFEIFIGEYVGKLHGYDASGSPLPGWPVSDPSVTALLWDKPSFADIDNNGELDIIVVSHDWLAPDIDHLMAFRPDGTQLPWSPVTYQSKQHAYTTIGDVDGDLELEIVALGDVSGVTHVIVFSNTGQVERQMPLMSSGGSHCGEPVLADLDGDSIPEIIVQSNLGMDVFKGNTGQAYPGWPINFPALSVKPMSNPVVGDVDGDQKPEIVTTIFGAKIQLRIYETDGTLNKKMGVKNMPIDESGVPAIADIDLDGRNEILVVSTDWQIGYDNSVWAFDLKGPKPHGPILWGQFGGNAAHQGRYPVPEL